MLLRVTDPRKIGSSQFLRRTVVLRSIFTEFYRGKILKYFLLLAVLPQNLLETVGVPGIAAENCSLPKTEALTLTKISITFCVRYLLT